MPSDKYDLKATPRKSKGSLTAQTYEFPIMNQRDERTLRQIIYDSSNGKILGRTSKQWGQLFLFYGIFYIALAALFAICMQGLMYTINYDAPKWKLGDSLIGMNPGVGFRPIAEDVEQGSLIWYDVSNETQVHQWTSNLDSFLDGYKTGSTNGKSCDFNSTPGIGQVCKVDTEGSLFGECKSDKAYGYANSAPCIFVKLNRIYGWVPDYYNDPATLPADMPADLKEFIASLPKNERDQIWVTCQGENPGDKEILGDIEYNPRGFPSYFYPFVNNKGYLSPLVSVKFVRPLPNQIINIECRAWAKNINYSGSHRDRQGSVHLELMIDAPLN